ncbi:hypothetical protein EVAR_55073_1 [Eumeta japonica]|uniref:Uncharacterized protein n=1 Tax=Eumeta variegata TaxID=151549 RepID=A0A4C1Z3Y2_EUMVA|nr:hypothetical protein EVAR_55073_1 [Eumeta japonica]
MHCRDDTYCNSRRTHDEDVLWGRARAQAEGLRACGGRRRPPAAGRRCANTANAVKPLNREITTRGLTRQISTKLKSEYLVIAARYCSRRRTTADAKADSFQQLHRQLHLRRARLRHELTTPTILRGIECPPERVNFLWPVRAPPRAAGPSASSIVHSQNNVRNMIPAAAALRPRAANGPLKCS